MMLSKRAQVAVRPCRSSPVCVRMPVIARATSVDVEAKKAPSSAADVKPEEPELPDVQVSTKDVQTFLNTLVSETSIAELQLQVGSFQLKVRRRTEPAVPAAAPVAAPTAAAPYDAQQTLVITKAPPLDTLATMGESVDESLVSIYSPKVGIFRRGKYAGGKRVGKGNAVNEGDQVKKGQVLGYVEQLGTFVAVEAPQAGEVVKVLLADGSPVEYKQEVAEMAPFFGGHIIGDSKYA